ncbi:MAG: 3'-5' exonuclease [Pseudomonadota bacterium]
MTSIYQGFVLQASYRIQQGKPVVYIFGRLQDGRTFIVRDHQQRPHFYVRQSDARHVVRARVLQSERVNFAGESLVRVEVDTPQQAPPLRDALHGMQVPTYEADVRFAMRYLIDRNIRGGIAIRGEPQHGLGTDLVFDDPETQPAEVQISPRVLSFDIETNPQTDRLLAIACYGCGVDEVVVVDPGSRPMPAHAIGVATEQAALAHFSERVRQLDPDVLTGWNVIDFDLSFLARVAERHRYNLQLGREPGAMRIRPAQGYFGSGHVSIPGRVVLDGIDLLRGAFVKLDDFSLEGVAQVVLGEGKTLSGRGREKVAQILDTYAHDLPSFAAYARTDARLVIDIIDKLDVMALAFVRSALTGMPPDRVAASIASFDFLYLSALQGRGVAAPSVQQSARGGEPQGGGAVFEPRVGIHAFVWVFDFKSLYRKY